MKDLTGQRFGKLVAIRPEGRRYGKLAWLCKCDCGNYYSTMTSMLTRGKAKSCGCNQKLACKKTNRYDLSGDYGICYINDGKNYFIFDKEDYDKIKEYCWCIDGNNYAQSGATKIRVHRLIMGFPEGKVVDHINHNTLDNRKCNLRVCTNQENMMNQKLNKRSTTGYKGVVFLKGNKKYRASIQYNKKVIYLGTFDNIEDAIKAREKGEQKYFGEYSYIKEKKL